MFCLPLNIDKCTTLNCVELSASKVAKMLERLNFMEPKVDGLAQE